MKATELIEKLKEYVEKYGDKDVKILDEVVVYAGGYEDFYLDCSLDYPMHGNFFLIE